MKNGNEAAFATADNGTENATTWQGQKGLTKREYFAGLAMQGLLASGKVDYDFVANKALGYADELLAELEKNK